MPRPRRWCCGPATTASSACPPGLCPPPPQTPCNTATRALPTCSLPSSDARLASSPAGGDTDALCEPASDPGLPGMLQGSEPDAKSHGSYWEGCSGASGPSSVDVASPVGGPWTPGYPLHGCTSACLMPLPPGLLRTASSPHCPSLGVFPLENIFGQIPYFLAAHRVRGSHPSSQAEQ